MSTSSRLCVSLHSILILLVLGVAGCGGTKEMTQEERLKAARLSGPVMGDFEGSIDDLKLDAEDLPAGYSFTTTISCAAPQVLRIYEQPQLFNGMLQIPVAREFQSVTGPSGEEGSIIYLQYPNKVTDQESSFVGGMMWGTGRRDRAPTPEKPQDYLSVDKTIVIWCLRFNSPIKKISQTKVRLAIDED